MFSAFESTTRKQHTSLWATLLSGGIYVVIIAVAVVIGARAATPAVESDVDVKIQSLPTQPPPAAPKVAPVPATKPATPPKLRPPRPRATTLVAPTKVAETIDPNAAGPGGEENSVGDSDGAGSAATAPAAPVQPEKPVVRRADPIQLPENATPPKPHADNAMPEYPVAAKQAGAQGLVILKIVVSERGTVTQISALRGEEPFTTAAIAAVKTWAFDPALVNGQPTAVFRIIKVPFRLTGG